MLDYILKNTLYTVNTTSGETHIGTIDDVSQYFDDGVTSMKRVPTPHQYKELKEFFSNLDKYEAKNGPTYIEDFYKIYYNEENNND